MTISLWNMNIMQMLVLPSIWFLMKIMSLSLTVGPGSMGLLAKPCTPTLSGCKDLGTFAGDFMLNLQFFNLRLPTTSYQFKAQ